MLLIALAACTRPGPATPQAPLDPEVADSCDRDRPQPELIDMSPALAPLQPAFTSCLDMAGSSQMHVTFVVDVHGRARDITANGTTLGGAARCVRWAMRRVSLRGPSACPTTGEFMIVGVPRSRRGPASRAWIERARAGQ